MFYPVNGDPYYANVSLLLPMTGANNGTTFTDVSPTPKTITQYNAITSTTQSKWGQGSGYFNGSGDYLTASGDFTLVSGDFTIEFWFYGSARVNRVLGNRPATGGWLMRVTPASSVEFYFWTSGGVTNTVIGSAPAANAWNHIGIVRSGDTHTVYVNGSGGTPLSTTNRPGTSAALLNIGRDVLYPTDPETMQGYFQDMRITLGVARYTADFATPAGPLPYRLPELPVRSILQPSFNQIARLGL